MNAAEWAPVAAGHGVALPGMVPPDWEGCPVFTSAADVAEALRCRDVRARARLAETEHQDEQALNAIHDKTLMLTDPGRRVLGRVLNPGWSRRTAARLRSAVATAFDLLVQRGEADAVAVGDVVVRLTRWAAFAPGVDDWAGVAAMIPTRRAEGATGDDVVSRVIRFAPQASDTEVFTLSASTFGVAGGGVGFIGTLFASTLLHLAKDANLAGRLRENPVDIPVFVDEMARLETTTPAIGRVVTTDTRIADVDLPAGSLFIIAAGEANREGNAGDQVNARPRRHYAFSAGRHRCTGSNLVRATMEVAVDEWLRSIPPFGLRDGRYIARPRYGRLDLLEAPLTWRPA